ncbi:hypothetical protein BGL_1c26920 [Burkholderia plantarii]|uniref:Uncharacterized protein n=1 Tax=Burkholderia plantarii TaxID=41899 RepID=A0A0B6RPA9_BURPL|nr:hypothetical protein BGL_1c26920 [Burkholderia plantarii]
MNLRQITNHGSVNSTHRKLYKPACMNLGHQQVHIDIEFAKPRFDRRLPDSGATHEYVLGIPYQLPRFRAQPGALATDQRKMWYRATGASTSLEFREYVAGKRRVEIVSDANLAFQATKPPRHLDLRHRHQTRGWLTRFRNHDFLPAGRSVDQARKPSLRFMNVDGLHDCSWWTRSTLVQSPILVNVRIERR